MSFKKITGMLYCCLLLCFLWSQCKSTEETEGTEQKTAEQTEETEQSADGEPDEINVFYGSYKITQFFPTQYYQNMKYDVMPEQEADSSWGGSWSSSPKF